jgi:hypothetical protein
MKLSEKDLAELFMSEVAATFATTADEIFPRLEADKNWQDFHISQEHALAIVFGIMAAHMERGIGSVMAAPLFSPYTRMALLLGGLDKLVSGEKTVASLVRLVTDEAKALGWKTKDILEMKRLATNFTEAALALAPLVEKMQVQMLSGLREER